MGAEEVAEMEPVGSEVEESPELQPASETGADETRSGAPDEGGVDESVLVGVAHDLGYTAEDIADWGERDFDMLQRLARKQSAGDSPAQGGSREEVGQAQGGAQQPEGEQQWQYYAAPEDVVREELGDAAYEQFVQPLSQRIATLEYAVGQALDAADQFRETQRDGAFESVVADLGDEYRELLDGPDAAGLRSQVHRDAEIIRQGRAQSGQPMTPAEAIRAAISMNLGSQEALVQKKKLLAAIKEHRNSFTRPPGGYTHPEEEGPRDRETAIKAVSAEIARKRDQG